MQVRPATGALLDRILDSSHSLWGEGLSRRAYAQYNAAQQATRWGRTHLERVALVSGGDVLSSAKRYSIDLAIDGGELRTLGIGAVFTPPGKRGRGYARALIDMLVEEGARGGYHAALLFSEIGPEYYSRCGFAIVPRDTVQLSVSRMKGAPGVAVRSGELRDLGPIAEMNAELAARYRLHVRRTTDWIEYGIAKKRLLAGLGGPGARHVLFFVAEEGGRAVAYVVIGATPRSWTLEECGDRDPSGARVGALMQVLLAREPASAPPVIASWLPEGWLPPQLSIASSAAAEQVMMMRPLAEAGRIGGPLRASEVHYWHGDAF
jgi:predicted N-acetyltransferase YhbS